jgi:predicted transcriptional regulator
MTTTTITIRTDAKLAKKISAIADAMDRSRNWIIEEAMKRYVEIEEAQIQGIKDAIKWFETNEGIPHEQVMAEMDAVISKYENKA